MASIAEVTFSAYTIQVLSVVSNLIWRSKRLKIYTSRILFQNVVPKLWRSRSDLAVTVETYTGRPTYEDSPLFLSLHKFRLRASQCSCWKQEIMLRLIALLEERCPYAEFVQLRDTHLSCHTMHPKCTTNADVMAPKC